MAGLLLINSLRPGDTLNWVMMGSGVAYHLFVTKPLSEPMLMYYQLDL